MFFLGLPERRVGVLGVDLGLAPQGGGADEGAVREVLDALDGLVPADEHVPGVLSAEPGLGAAVGVGLGRGHHLGLSFLTKHKVDLFWLTLMGGRDWNHLGHREMHDLIRK